MCGGDHNVALRMGLMLSVCVSCIAVFAGSSSGGPTPASEFSDPLHLAGSRVRLSAPALGDRKQSGTVVEVRDDTLLFMADKRSVRTFVPTASLTSLEVSRGSRSHTLAGAGLGFLTGAVAGGVIGGTSGSTTNNEESGLAVAFGALVGGGAGLVIGAIIGSRHTERWDALRLPIRIGVYPNTDSIRLSARVALR